MRVTGRRRPSAEIILTPLIDILFIVLLFLVLTATFTDSTSLRLSLPQARTAIREAQQLSGTIRITVAADGTLGSDGHPVSLDDLGRLLGAVADKDAVNVLLAADRSASHGEVVAVIDAVRQAGIFRLSIETLPRRTASPAG